MYISGISGVPKNLNEVQRTLLRRRALLKKQNSQCGSARIYVLSHADRKEVS